VQDPSGQRLGEAIARVSQRAAFELVYAVTSAKLYGIIIRLVPCDVAARLDREDSIAKTWVRRALAELKDLAARSGEQP
jgi:hypothetical protein